MVQGNKEQVFQIDAGYSVGPAALGTVCYKEGWIDEAVPEWEESLKLNPEEVMSCYAFW